MAEFQPRVFSGVQPTGNLHLGNYLGAVSRWVPLQDQMPTIFCVVDSHAITAGFPDPHELAQATREVTAAYMAAGIDPKKSIIFNQSQVREHTELAWIFNCVARMGWLNRMTQFKEKAGKNKENASVGLFAYPNLMAADILAYRATHVPVGDDQKQHLELTRDIAAKFNNDFAERIKELDIGIANPTPSPELPEYLYFPLTEPMIAGPATRIMSLRDGTKKMSKSDPSDLSRINLTDDADSISKKIKKAKTDPDALPSETDGLEGRPEADNLVGIFAALSGATKADVLKEYGGQQFSAFKPALSDLAVEKLSPMTDQMRHLMDDRAEIDAILKDGAEKASAIAEPVLKDVRKIIGFIDVR
ncbi:tryptophan--tRNA ligase [Stappia sp. BW2]|uniref:tryptophan--tRNA ligase n=1 Tax=Stappia sp. BW2 TaxID=2592622 RepID=UPI0011DE5BEE|nr:tryptophan--tRNA ligase [Stappia sp. BW2]TYC72334.1 tryptophan--tRNA ligase [Stappia sp. BW2]